MEGELFVAFNPNIVMEQICPFLAPGISRIIEALPVELLSRLEEIRIRHSRPLTVYWAGGEAYLSSKGVVSRIEDARPASGEDIEKTVELISGYSLYAYEDELRQGYLTIPGGHRVGLAGRAVVEGGKIKTITDISFINFRVARQVKGAGTKVLPFLVDRRSGNILNTLIVSPPQGGKTTLLRDLALLISSGVGVVGQRGKKVGIVDERSEIAGCYQGVPQLDIGFRTDVLDSCPKAEGIMMLLRSMSPQVIITDEIGREEDAGAIEEIINAGVVIIASAHGSSLEEICRRPILGCLLEKNYFERLIFLSNKKGPGTLEMIVEGEKGLPLYSARSGWE